MATIKRADKKSKEDERRQVDKRIHVANERIDQRAKKDSKQRNERGWHALHSLTRHCRVLSAQKQVRYTIELDPSNPVSKSELDALPIWVSVHSK